jgi:hypothetical protein
MNLLSEQIKTYHLFRPSARLHNKNNVTHKKIIQIYLTSGKTTITSKKGKEQTTDA